MLYRVESHGGSALKFDPGDFWFQLLALALFVPFLFGVQLLVGPFSTIPAHQRYDLFGLSLLVGIVGAVHLAGRFQANEKLREVVQHLSQLVPEFEQPWLYTENRMVEYEGNARVPEIWIISPDLGKDVDLHDAAFQEVVRRNIQEKKIQYIYIYPDTEQTRAKVPALRQLFSRRTSALCRCPVGETVFRQLTVTHIAIYNPRMKQGADSLSAYMELPVGGVPHWTRVRDQAAKDLAGRYQRVLELNTVYRGDE